LKASGLVDDAKLASGRAESLAKRGWGNSAIAARLAAEGFGDQEAREAIEALEPEIQRVAPFVADIPDRRKAWALLVRRGFAHDSVEDVLGTLDEGP
jgi:SOS response regulatory protein OraA/RecX